ncbi:hypothetical protein HUT06_05015 [Actinomadura sp. NAK00032]|uniref:hypothetical protein n=1 Tax=Actinomadura sp. NAK00032 TaxID=2742128 RepID=UPI001592A189|nr:hypothetical protein [Actinomadura sp. NAK00032]QKW33468.1 hypothetical protein HUT06_05015 [Actinomadura sp. NAK00032]
MDEVPGNNELPVAHPRVVAGKVDGMADQIKEGLGLGDPVESKTGGVNPLPCGKEADRRAVRRTNPPDTNPYLEPWFVDYSPYTMTVNTWVSVRSKAEATAALTRLSERLSSTGWRITAFSRPADGTWQLRVTAPEKGYGAVLEAPIAGAGTEQRIGLDVSSPCFRHPEEERS